MKNVYSVLDRVTGIYGEPVIMPMPAIGGHESVLRWFQSALQNIDEASKGNRTPTDFALYFIGTYDEMDGVLSPIAPKVFLSVIGVAHEKEFPLNMEVKKDE